MVVHAYIVVGKLRLENHEFGSSLSIHLTHSKTKGECNKKARNSYSYSLSLSFVKMPIFYVPGLTLNS